MTTLDRHSLAFFGALAALAALPVSPDAQEAVVNAPVAPEAIYVARAGDTGGLSVIDLNGFGASTGAPEFDIVFGPDSEGQTRFPFNPNLALQGTQLVPPLTPGSTTTNGGSRGVFTLTEDSELNDRLLERPEYASITDLALGAPLDLAFHNGLPFGCSSGGGNLCASSFLQRLEVALAGPNTLRPALDGDPVLNLVEQGGNPISFAPHPNPPQAVSPPLCLDPLIRGLEPTSSETTRNGFVNLLVPGDALGDPSIGLPPTGLLSREQNAFFVGPSSPQANVNLCSSFMIRQQVGHFLYLADRSAQQLVVLNSNSFDVLARIPVGDAVELATGPNLDRLAVADRAGNAVHFVDIDPRSSTFHRVLETVPVGRSPRGIAWDPGNEDVLVCNEGDDSISVISAATLQVRKTVTAPGLRRPFAVAVTERQNQFGLQRFVYFGWILDRDGSLWLFESGPDGTGGWGFDDIVGRAPIRFPGARALQPDPLRLEGGVWIAHEDAEGGALSNVVVDADPGIQPLTPGETPNLRDLVLSVARTIGADQLTGTPLDLGFDNLRNFGALENLASPFAAGAPAPMNGKSLVRSLDGLGFHNTSEPTYLFVPVRGGDSGSGAVDVIDLATGQRIDTDVFQPGVQSISAPGARLVMDYFRQ